MVDITNGEVIQRLVDIARLQTKGDNVMRALSKEIVPIININEIPRVFKIIDGNPNDSDKTFSVPAGKAWKILYGFVSFVSTATVGDRRLEFVIRDENDVTFWRTLALNVQTASATERYNFSPGTDDATESVATIHIMPIPKDTLLLENWDIRIFDGTAVDAAADDMTVTLVIEETNLGRGAFSGIPG